MRPVTAFGHAAPVASGAGESSGVKSPVVDDGTVKFPRVEGIDGDGASVFDGLSKPVEINGPAPTPLSVTWSFNSALSLSLVGAVPSSVFVMSLCFLL